MTPLMWLGGPEDASLLQLTGTWIDSAGSLYQLYLSDTQIDVMTTRLNGNRLYTKGLIRELEGSIAWGKVPRHF
jgi:hypothetical protein